MLDDVISADEAGGRRVRRCSRLVRRAGILVLAAWAGPVVPAGAGPAAEAVSPIAGQEAGSTFRVALFNIRELSADKLTDVGARGIGQDPQARAAATIVQRVRPDVLVVQEIDQPQDGPRERNARRFADAYLGTGEAPIEYPYVYSAPTNTGVLTGVDVNRDGIVATPELRGDRLHGEDSYGFGVYPGQYSMAVLSRLPLLVDEVRTFQRFLWRDLPGHHMPPDFYSPDAEALLRLSSKSHWDLPVQVGEGTVHLWISHPTPPVFDADEDRNGRRNFDEIKLWVEYLEGGSTLVDDAGERGGYRAEAPFVIVGDLNARPGQVESRYDGRTAISQLLEHPRIRDVGDVLVSRGALRGHEPGPPLHPERATTDFAVDARIDYLLPSVELRVLDGGVFWPDAQESPEAHELAMRASDHRLVWLDLQIRAAARSG